MKNFSHIRFYIVFVFSIFFHLSNTFAQSVISDTTFKYFPGNSQPSDEWKISSFDDSAWLTGTYSVGWGDSDDYTTIEKVPSCYLRYKFDLTDSAKAAIQDLVFFADFDDAFVAYINGIEFARVNLGEFNSPVAFNQLADRSHEAEFYRNTNYPVLGYYIDDTIVEKHLFEQDNILAIEVHNDSISGSDLSMYSALINTEGYYNIFDIVSRYKRSVELDSSNLPIVVLESDEFGILVDPEGYEDIPKVTAKMGIIDNGTGKYNHPGDPHNNYSGEIGIEVRGQSSSTFPKRSYNFELRDPQGNDTSLSLLGLPKESDWILQGPFADKSQIRNALIFELGRKTGHWNPRTAFCELILNGEYLGLYTIIEDIKRDTFRIDVANLNSTETAGNDVTGGYILKYDKGGSTTQIKIVYPKAKDLQPEQEEYIEQFIAEYDSVLRTNDGIDPIKGYKKYIDNISLIDYMIIAEFAKNCDSYLFSSYLYKDRDDRNNKLVYGPLWDFDLCFGNSIWQEGFQTEEWQFAYPGNDRFHARRLLEDTAFVSLFENRWQTMRAGFLSNDSVFARIDSLTSWMTGPIERNYQIWPVIGKGVFFPAYETFTYEEEINYIKNWLTERTSWIDENITEIYYPVTHYTSVDEIPFAENKVVETIYPNPFTDEINISLNLENQSAVQVCLISVNGQVNEIISPVNTERGNYIIHWKADRYYPNGIYILEVRIDGKVASHTKVLKID